MIRFFLGLETFKVTLKEPCKEKIKNEYLTLKGFWNFCSQNANNRPRNKYISVIFYIPKGPTADYPKMRGHRALIITFYVMQPCITTAFAFHLSRPSRSLSERKGLQRWCNHPLLLETPGRRYFTWRDSCAGVVLVVHDEAAGFVRNTECEIWFLLTVFFKEEKIFSQTANS